MASLPLFRLRAEPKGIDSIASDPMYAGRSQRKFLPGSPGSTAPSVQSRKPCMQLGLAQSQLHTLAQFCPPRERSVNPSHLPDCVHAEVETLSHVASGPGRETGAGPRLPGFEVGWTFSFKSGSSAVGAAFPFSIFASLPTLGGDKLASRSARSTSSGRGISHPHELIQHLAWEMHGRAASLKRWGDPMSYDCHLATRSPARWDLFRQHFLEDVQFADAERVDAASYLLLF